MDDQPKKPSTRGKKKREEEPVEPAVDAAEEPSAAEPPSSEQETGAPGDRTPVNVFALAQFYLGVFVDLAFQRMGLHADAVSGTVVRDMEQAKVAVDISAFLAEAIMPKVADSGRRELMGLVRDLRLNYAKQAQNPTESAGG